MDEFNPLRYVLAFVFVIGLLGVLAWSLRRFGHGQKMFGAKDAEGRLRVVEMRWLDPKRRLVLVRRDEVEHLLLLADGRELVIETVKKKDE